VESNLTLSIHPDPWLDLLRPYVASAVRALAADGVHIERSWLDPRDPRDATIVCAGDDGVRSALVWDEETGWRRGTFVDGRPGERTVLAEVAYVGGGLLPAAKVLADRVVRSPAGGEGSPRRVYRSAGDLRDGLDDTLRSL
jgi:hypothetical protein